MCTLKLSVFLMMACIIVNTFWLLSHDKFRYFDISRPMDILAGQLRNRWSIAIAFATMLSTTSGLFLQQRFFFIRRGDQNLSNVYC